MTSDYMLKRRAQKLALLENVTLPVANVVMGGQPFAPLTPAGADVAGMEWPFNVARCDPAVQLYIGRACYDWWLKDDSILPLHDMCLNANMAHGYYHFLRPNHIQAQADLYLHQLEKVGGPGKVAPILDIEHFPVPKPRRASDKALAEWEHENPSGSAWAGQVRTWLDVVERALGRRCILYGSPSSFAVLYSGGVPPAWLAGYDVWLAWYPYWWLIPTFKNGPPASVIPKWAGRVIAWQYFDRGRQNHFEPNDLNWVNPGYLAEVTQ